MTQTIVEVQIGNYVIRPHPTPDGQVWIEIKRIDEQGLHGIDFGPEITIDLDAEFAKRIAK